MVSATLELRGFVRGIRELAGSTRFEAVSRTCTTLADELERLLGLRLAGGVANSLLRACERALCGDGFRAVFRGDLQSVPASGTPRLVLRLEPSQRVADLLAALRAFDGNGDFVLRHGADGTGDPTAPVAERTSSGEGR